MNKKAILKGYFQGVLAFCGGVGILVCYALLFGDNDREISSLVSFLLGVSLFLGSFSAGYHARRSGYLHGACVGILWWLSRNIFLGFFLSGIPIQDQWAGTVVYYLVLGAIGGLCGVNYVIIKKQEENSLLLKMFKN